MDYNNTRNNPNPNSNPNSTYTRIVFQLLVGVLVADLSPQAWAVVDTIDNSVVYTFEYNSVEEEIEVLYISFEREGGFTQFNRYTRPEFGGEGQNPHPYTQENFTEADLARVMYFTRNEQAHVRMLV